ncbi:MULTISPECIES: hypothetical protein [Pseudomonas]|uniref:NAD synthetase n=1 Tax=Pseudomonas fluorescens LMG 5329 TaxID=1324332 RepID=A0A0A1Z1U2_PSEFL|nr:MULTISPECIES: hypothetical protein [Pseudomonas]KGE67199.1 NAD synthetase [Pseudomonas fluorescens LMG 5329]NWE03668.1 NAD synthetase [Pseudomonas sp. IPO3749]NWF20199.1 NAD synthetase [Pseudomonas sp. IPO3749]
MAISVLKDGFPSAHLATRERVESSIDLRRLFAAIDADPAIAGAGVVYLDSQLWPVTLREFQPICSVLPKRVVLREMPGSLARLDFVRRLEYEPRESEVVFESIGMGVACGTALLSWLVIAGGSALSPFTAGLSGALAVIGRAAFVASFGQCANGLYRVYKEAREPAHIDWLDSEPWYQHTTAILDAVSLIGASTSFLTTVKLASATKASTGRSWRDVLRRMNRQERAKLTKELLSINHPHLSAKLIKLKQLSGDFPKRYTQAQLRHATLAQLKDTVAVGGAVAGSATSGNLRTIAVGLYEEFDE